MKTSDLGNFILYFALLITISVSAQNSTVKNPASGDSCILFLNRSENIRSLNSQIVTVGQHQLRKGYSGKITNSLEGKITGVEIKTGSSGSLGSSVFFMRGDRSLVLDNQPLYIVDGVQVQSKVWSLMGFDYGNLVNDYNLDDIESVTVLKPGQATSLYGYDGGNGAVIITTRKAHDPGFHIDYNTSFVRSRIADFPEFQNNYGQGLNEEFSYVNENGNGIFDGSWGPKLNGQLIAQFDGPSTGWINGQTVVVRGGDTWAREQALLNGIDNSINPTPWIAQPDNVKDFFKAAYSLTNNLGLSWAGKNGGVRVSYTNVGSDEVTPNTYFQKNSFGGNFNYTIYKKLKIFSTYQNSKLNYRNTPTNTYPYTNSPMHYFAMMGRQVNTQNLKEYWQRGSVNQNQFNYLNEYYNNPWYSVYENDSPLTRSNINGTFGVSFELAKGLSLNYTGGINKISLRETLNVSDGDLSGYYSISKGEEMSQTNYNQYIFADYTFKTGKEISLNLFSGFKFNRIENSGKYKTGPVDPIEFNIQGELNGFYGGLTVEGKNVYAIRITMSRDHYKDVGQTGAPLNYALSSGVDFKKLIRMPDLITKIDIQAGYSRLILESSPGLTPYHSLKEDISPVSTLMEFTAGLNFGILKNRITGSLVYYKSHSKDGWEEIPTIHNNLYIDNLASVQNSGFEINFSFIPIKTRKIKWESSISYFKNNNKIIDLGEPISSLTILPEPAKYVNETGQPAGNLYGFKFITVDGKILFNNGLPLSTVKTGLLGNVNPDYIIYCFNSLSFNKLNIAFNLEFSKGGVYYSQFYHAGTTSGNLSNTDNRENGIVGYGVRLDESGNYYIPNDVNVSTQDYFKRIRSIQEYFVMDATYLKLKEITISYPFTIRQKLNLTCSLFAQNLLTFSKNKDYNNGGLIYYNNKYYRGYNAYSLPETYQLGVKIQLQI